MSSKFSLEKLRDDPDFAALFAKKAEDIRQNKADLVEAANAYQSKYKQQIEAGTRKRQLMLSEGKEKGLTEDEIFRDNQLFIPTAQTPILNFLYFLLLETTQHDPQIRELYLLKEELEKKYPEAPHDGPQPPVQEKLPNMLSYVYGSVNDDTMSTLKKLKTMAMSENEKEAFVAFRKGREMAQKYGLDWDKIPYNR